ncbi:hypothetical protein VNO77_16434 [Canavalia gladiata]|uniref:C2 domain-containing protein n=1 Tax=Canavalia gladiata TaxID=3824 RepID=A0AAN9M123_CANGL
MQQIQRVYLSPKLWYLRVSIIEARDIMPGHKGLEVVRLPEFSTKVQVGNQIWRTRNAAPSTTRSFSNPYWNEEVLFVVTEPFEDYLSVSVEDGVGPGREEVVATMLLPVAKIEKRIDEETVTSRWFNLESHFGSAGDNQKLITRFVSQIHMRISIDDGYDLLDEGTIHSSDVRTIDKRLWKPQVGVLEMRILGAVGLAPRKIKDGRGVIDAYCVAKYGKEWVQTHTVVDSLSPMWNEQYRWEVYEPCSVLTIGVFDDGRINRNTTTNIIDCDYPIGKVKIRLSTIETNRVYAYCYPLLKLHLTGLRKMGELELVLKFSLLRYGAVNVVESKLSNVELPLSKDVVRYITTGDDFPLWAPRKSKGNFSRLVSTLSGPIAVLKWLEEICNWKNPVSSALFLFISLTLVMLPAFIIPTIILYMAFVVGWNYRFRPRYPPQTRFSNDVDVDTDELDEELDTFPTTASDDIVRMRYDRLRSVAGMVQTVVGDIATHAERFQELLTWRDPRATFLFMMFCLVAAVGFCVVPIRVLVALLGLYSLRPPSFRNEFPSPFVCFFNRLPGKADIILDAGEERELDAVWQDTESLLIVWFRFSFCGDFLLLMVRDGSFDHCFSSVRFRSQSPSMCFPNASWFNDLSEALFNDFKKLSTSDSGFSVIPNHSGNVQREKNCKHRIVQSSVYTNTII